MSTKLLRRPKPLPAPTTVRDTVLKGLLGGTRVKG